MTGAVDLPLDLADLSFTASDGAVVRRSVLPSGVRVLSEQVPAARSATLGFWVAVGSRDEVAPAFGSTHFLEHLLFKGTTTRSALDIAVAFDEVGGEHNAMTAKEYTCYYAKVRDRDVPMAIDVLADMFTSSTIDADAFETERGVILEELAMADDDPADVAGEKFFQAVFGDHPLGRPIGGDAAAIRAATRDAVWGHYRANYRPQDLVVTVAGAVDHDLLVAAVSRALERAGWDLGVAAPPVPRRAPGRVSFGAPTGVELIERPLEQTNLLIGVPGLAAADPRRSALTVLNAVLGGGMSSRLFQEVRERHGLAYSVYSFAPSYSDAGVLGLYAGCSPANAPRVASLLLQEFDRLADSGITADELRRVRGQLAGASALALEDSDTRMSRLGRSELTLGEYTDLDEGLRRLDAVTRDDVRELARELRARPLSATAVGAVDDSVFAALDDARPAA
ncbi:M16 family metallopeptidase [Diaminobutyricimonas aerilata]|uniref:M16 family metallopeptidase n=1 Tax=Diaminobutyricimonas aerilata TaxID=1162967 RepID=UPI000C2334AE|nr:pitrilysin family protein [Diaminobutyricimonas aerilata]